MATRSKSQQCQSLFSVPLICAACSVWLCFVYLQLVSVLGCLFNFFLNIFLICLCFVYLPVFCLQYRRDTIKDSYD